jgi:hypothetical protein
MSLKPGRGGNPFTPPPKAPGGDIDIDIGKILQPGKGGGGSVTLPGGGGGGKGRGQPDLPPSKPGKGGDAPAGKPPVKDTPDNAGASSRLAGGTTAGAGLLGAGLGAGIAGAVTAASNAAAVVAGGDAAKAVAETGAKIIENITEFLSNPNVIGAVVGVTALVVLGPIVVASMSKK